jgi:magnesium chelatase family protein
VKYKELTSDKSGEDSKTIRERVQRAREFQLKRFKNEKNIYCNAHMQSREIGKYCKTDQEGQELIKNAITMLGLSARAYDRILKISRTIADLEHSEKILTNHVSEAIQYRSLDRQLWL